MESATSYYARRNFRSQALSWLSNRGAARRGRRLNCEWPGAGRKPSFRKWKTLAKADRGDRGSVRVFARQLAPQSATATNREQTFCKDDRSVELERAAKATTHNTAFSNLHLRRLLALALTADGRVCRSRQCMCRLDDDCIFARYW